jgi:hypothetical protein
VREGEVVPAPYGEKVDETNPDPPCFLEDWIEAFAKSGLKTERRQKIMA